MANTRAEYVFGTRKLRPWRKPGSKESLREILANPRPVPRHHFPTSMHPVLTSIVPELFLWQRIHENYILNPHVMVTEQQMYPVLPRDCAPARIIRPHPTPYPSYRRSVIPAYMKYHIHRTGGELAALELPAMFAREEDILAGFESPTTSESTVFPQDEEVSITVSPTVHPPLSRPLLRRPLLHPPPTPTPILHTSFSRLHLNKTDLKVYTTFSLTTLEHALDDPCDMKGFYNTHYPLILRSIPCRTSNGRSMGANLVYLYHPMVPRVISTTVFQPTILHSPSETSLHQGSEHTLSSTLRMLPSVIPSSVADVGDAEDDESVNEYTTGTLNLNLNTLGPYY